MSSKCPKWATHLFILSLLLLPVRLFAVTILQGQLIPAENVEFELIDGFVFQNSIRIKVDGEELGHFFGSGGTWATTFERKVNELNGVQGMFYLPVSKRTLRGHQVVEQIVHFPEQRTSNHDGPKSSCAQDLESIKKKAISASEINRELLDRLDQLLPQNHRRPASQGD